MRKASVSVMLSVLVAVLPGAATAQDKSGYNDLAPIVSEPVFNRESLAKARDAYTDGGVMSRKEYERQRLKELRALDSAVQAAREQIEESVWKCYTTYQEIRRLDSNTPDYEGLARRALDAAPAMVKKYNKQELDTNDQQQAAAFAAKAIWEVGGAIVNSYNLSKERDSYARHYSTSRRTIRQQMAGLVTQRYTTAQYAVQASGKAAAIGVSVTPSLANTYINDIIELRNNSRKDLVACTLLVNLNGINAANEEPNGDSHFHYVSYWPAGESRYVWYPSLAFSGIASNESVDVIQKVIVGVYSDRLTTTVSLDFAGDPYDRYVKEWADKHLPNKSFGGRWYTNQETWVDPAGFEVTYKGDVARFTVRTVTVEAISGSRSVRIFDGDPGWSSSQKKWICHEKFNAINPKTVNVIISFPGSSYEHVMTWNR